MLVFSAAWVKKKVYSCDSLVYSADIICELLFDILLHLWLDVLCHRSGGFGWTALVGQRCWSANLCRGIFGIAHVSL
uniref:Uncharacterized protein n=1 Tax=Arundo donax TaxID=35708 RepID=A0A0A8XV90_ARUDO